MSTWIVRFVLFFIACLAITHAYPPLRSRTTWQKTHPGRFRADYAGRAYDYPNSVDKADDDLSDNNGFATWLFRSRKFCCAPPL